MSNMSVVEVARKLTTTMTTTSIAVDDDDDYDDVGDCALSFNNGDSRVG